MGSITNPEHPLFIAEISSNHNGDIQRCKDTIDAVKEAGCDGVKFQLFKIKDLFSPEALAAKPELGKRVAWELKEELIPELAEYTRKRGLLFSCTPFYLDAVDILAPHVDFFKIASYELLWKDLFKRCAEKAKPIVFSIGMTSEAEVGAAIDFLRDTPVNEILVLHCNSSYPTPLSDTHLSVIPALRHRFSHHLPGKTIEFGWSDHTVKESVILSSVLKHDSKMIEFHVDLDGKGYEFAAGHCWLPEQIGKVISILREAKIAEGRPEITPSSSELIEREWRADPSDGLRPLLHTRKTLAGRQ